MRKSIISVIALLFSFHSAGLFSEGVRDPSEPFGFGMKEKKVKKHTPDVDYELTYIFISEQRKMAVINNRSYVEGERIGSYRIKNIGAHEVIIGNSDRTRVLKLYPVDKKGFSIR